MKMFKSKPEGRTLSGLVKRDDDLGDSVWCWLGSSHVAPEIEVA